MRQHGLASDVEGLPYFNLACRNPACYFPAAFRTPCSSRRCQPFGLASSWLHAATRPHCSELVAHRFRLGSSASCVEPARVFAMLVGASPARDGPEGVNPSPVSLMRGFGLQAEGCARLLKHCGSHRLPAAQPPLKLRRVRRSLGAGGKPGATPLGTGCGAKPPGRESQERDSILFRSNHHRHGRRLGQGRSGPRRSRVRPSR